MNLKVGDVVKIKRPHNLKVSENDNGGVGQITVIDKDGTARVKTNKTFFNEFNWESLKWLEPYRIT